MVKIEFYYKSADKDKTEAMREAIDIALFGTNVQCNFNRSEICTCLGSFAW